LIQKSAGAGTTLIYTATTNYGVIDAMVGEIEFIGSFGFNNTVDGVVKGIATLDLPPTANFTNDGTFSPGASPGVLTVIGDFKSTATSVLDIELNGMTQGVDYDLLAITGTNVIMDGSVNVIMGFEGFVNDEFIVATTTGTISQCALAPTAVSVHNGVQYDFSVACRNDNEVVLTITAKLDIQNPDVFTQNITVQLDANGNAMISPLDIDNGSSDNYSLTENLDFSLDVSSFDCSDLGVNIVTLTVTDEAGNFASATATVTVEDVNAPTVVTQNITVQLDASGNATISTNAIDNGTSDNCTLSSFSLDVTTFDCSDLGVNTVNLTATDQSGNSSSSSAIVTVEDVNAPTVVTQNITVQLDASGNASITANNIDNGTSDNCTISSLNLDVTTFDCSNLGVNTVNLIAIDQSGNSSSAQATVTVEDPISPSVVTQDITIQLDATGNASIVASDIDNGSTDNCSIASLSVDITEFTCADLGANTVALTVTDQSGNTNSASAVVTVEDYIVPTVNCPNGFIVEIIGDFTLPDYYIEGDVTASDNCGFTVQQTPVPGTNLPDGDYVILIEAIDDFGNVASCSFDLKVVDTTLSVDGQQLLDSDIILFPNPTTNVVTLKNNSTISLLNATIIDISGRLLSVTNLKAMGSSTKLSLEAYASGTYFIKIDAVNGSIVKQVIKK
jgi:hypothetical protein